ncbi:MAG: hypothetical protein A3H06_01140 [Candidatus Colwellbacteria bacterium RIFCSPLOWO2_12_FULL_44_13]|uniref:Cob(I)yrinic acid a,c-diamide adenosyltransferase n=3 Tax=Candidatus Colwelliibacteriota TaxID=1817904 RepID=A0A1G1Z9I4_9BACT|nr:MAG: hypothetical protein A3F24_01680 [Candidatus Colwellbacteria bacterium RIFCSPHIGHO2_12_FULL_44_17]OGY60530.1 MAG: hypothetical protein A3I31_02360 [Candidatus Colwellbacteria bacterium RIFCSPLOWO2_02_FULL_44_20b]OGY61635.1 MAG: hypothetical protein A3H06_01140 [Candidatus Colwellbacteria bacterium RIFCSPLOWO2_12_FULL_44_13]
MILVFTGNGKGKTTAAIGQAIRAAGQGKRVGIFQFIKSPKVETGEEKTLKKLTKEIYLEKGGEGFVGILGDTLPIEAHKKAAEFHFKKAKKAIAENRFDLIVLDEINVAGMLNLIVKEEIISFAKEIPESIDVIFTGRGAHQELIEIAHLVTEFKEIKHPYQKGEKARRGIEY